MSPQAATGFQPARAPVPGGLSATGEAEVFDKNGRLIIAKHETPEENEKGKSVHSERRAKEVVDLPKRTESPYDVSA